MNAPGVALRIARILAAAAIGAGCQTEAVVRPVARSSEELLRDQKIFFEIPPGWVVEKSRASLGPEVTELELRTPLSGIDARVSIYRRERVPGQLVEGLLQSVRALDRDAEVRRLPETADSAGADYVFRQRGGAGESLCEGSLRVRNIGGRTFVFAVAGLQVPSRKARADFLAAVESFKAE